MIKRFLVFINLNSGEENKEKVLQHVVSNTSFRGSSFWILACAILIASIGLNVNSTAVIIGAMLISPLMGPIVGAGFGLGTYDSSLLKKSLKNLLIATIVGLIVSTIYFFISPFKETQSELLARTTPTIYDVLIAFFGGLVGVIAITRVEKGNPIPGVAIATALMPPLCTAGYGLAIGNINFFLGAIFLYTINCVFICIATFSIVKYLKYPAITYANVNYAKKIKYTITLLIVLMIVPSTYFAYELVLEKQFISKANTFIDQKFKNKGYTLIYQNINSRSNPKKITVAFFSKKFSSPEIDSLNMEIKKFGLTSTELIIKQDTTNLRKNILNEIKKENLYFLKKDKQLSILQQKINNDSYENEKLTAEVKILFPKISAISIANHYFQKDDKSTANIPVALYVSKVAINKSEEIRLKKWLELRLTLADILLYRK